MKIFVPYAVKDIGGPSTFVKKFQAGMKKNGHEVFFEHRPDYDILFLIVQAPFRYLWEAKRYNKPIVQRLDGAYYFTTSGWRYPLLNLKARIIRSYFTDFAIYQSNYSKYSVEKLWGKLPKERSVIIYNGVDSEVFSPAGEKTALRDNPSQNIFFTASEFRRKDQIIPILNLIKEYRLNYDKNFKLVVAGSFNRELKGFEQNLRKIPNVQYVGKIPNGKLPAYERSADVFLFTHLNPPCPNNIIEALACGLPVCGVADGAMKEIVDSNSGILAESQGDAFWYRREYNSNQLANNLHSILSNRSDYSKAARQQFITNFTLEKMIDNYSQTLEKLVR